MTTISNQPKMPITQGPIVPKDLSFHMWPPITDEDEKLVLASLRQDSHASGPHVKMLADEFAAWNGNTYCMPTNAGTAALHMCVAGCDIQAGDEVITTALSWTSSATCIIHHNAIPIFVDACWDDMHMDVAKVEAQITDRTKAILVVHYWGVACDMDPILALAKKYNLKVIEDACQAHGATYKGKKVGTMGDAAAFSLNQNKNFCGGEGGVFVSNNEEIFKRGLAVCSFGDMRPADSGRDYHEYGLGWQYRTSDLPAAFALSQLRKLDKTNEWARINWHMLDDLLEGTPHLVRPFSSQERPTNGYTYVIRPSLEYAKARGVDPKKLTLAITKATKARGLNLSFSNWVLPAHGVFQGKNAYGKGSPWSDGHARKNISYDLDQYPVAMQCIDTAIANLNLHRPPNGPEQIKAMAAVIRYVFENLDSLEVEA